MLYNNALYQNYLYKCSSPHVFALLSDHCLTIIVLSLLVYDDYSTDHGVQTWVCDEGQEYQPLSQPVRD